MTQNATASATQAALSTRIADLSSSFSTQFVELSSLETANKCTDAPASIDYSGNSAVSNSLKTWLEDTQGKIDKVTWDAVWNNSRVTIHKLTGEFLHVYIVYFDEPKLHYKKSIFDVDNSCWLNR